jgi:pyrophosphate--fructose-6-phosphate 1-phosphotransferase
MGRSASHVTLECALQTQANLALIAEEVREKQQTLDQLADEVARLVQRRAEAGRSYGVVLVPEGLIEFVPEIQQLIAELNRLLAAKADVTGLGPGARQAFESLPERIQQQLLLDRDAHGNVQVSRIETEQLLIEKVQQRLGRPFQTLAHFFGYEGRCAQPSNFDAAYTYALGRLAAVLAASGKTGYLCSLRELIREPARWRPVGVPLTSMMRIETRKGKDVPVVARALVRTSAEPFRSFAAWRDGWGLEDAYVHPGPIQYFGPPAIADAVTHTLRLERG